MVSGLDFLILTTVHSVELSFGQWSKKKWMPREKDLTHTQWTEKEKIDNPYRWLPDFVQIQSFAENFIFLTPRAYIHYLLLPCRVYFKKHFFKQETSFSGRSTTFEGPKRSDSITETPLLTSSQLWVTSVPNSWKNSLSISQKQRPQEAEQERKTLCQAIAVGKRDQHSVWAQLHWNGGQEGVFKCWCERHSKSSVFADWLYPKKNYTL